MAVSPPLVVVGAFCASPSHTAQGEAYVYSCSCSGTTCTCSAGTIIVGTSPGTNDQFGYAVAVQGTTIVVGAPMKTSTDQHNGGYYTYTCTTASPPACSQAAGPIYESSSMIQEDDEFGYSVALSAKSLLIGSPGQSGGYYGTTYLMSCTSASACTTVTQQHTGSVNNGYCGLGVGMDLNGNAAFGCPLAGNGLVYYWQACVSPCATCTGASTTCTSCISGYYLYNGACYNPCPAGTYASGSSCVACTAPCASCSRPRHSPPRRKTWC